MFRNLCARASLHRVFLLILLPLSLVGAEPAFATVKSMMPDFYAEPGLNPFRDQVSANINEAIDPFSGALHLTHIDLVIPGNGGLDIKIQRSYNSNNVYLSRKSPTNLAPNLTTLLPRSAYGMGWTMHFGRVLKSADATGFADICGFGTPVGGDTLGDAVLELPDGSQQVLYYNSTPFSARFITREQWVADCIPDGLLVTSPEGMKYAMTQHVVNNSSTYTTAQDHAWYTTQITDRSNNSLFISYLTLPSGKSGLISSITSNDQRSVNFTYLNSTDPVNVLLSTISANTAYGQLWKYQYTADTTGGGNYQLTQVTRPDNLVWKYQYYNKTAGLPGDKVLQQITYPYGATVNYAYDYVCFMGVTCSSVYDTFYSLVVASKTNGAIGGVEITPGTWTYTYAPSTTEDVTTVTFPGGSYVYKHFGSKLLFGGSTIPGKTLWKIGLLKERETRNGSTVVDRVVYTWDAPYAISNEQYVRPPYDGTDSNHPRYADSAVYLPLLLRKDIIRDGTTYTTTYSNFITADGSFNPQTVTESGQTTRTTGLTYFPRVAGQNIVHLVKDEVLSGESAGKSIYRTFDGDGNLIEIVRHGVRENYSYYTNGDLYSKTNALNNDWFYQSYVRGIPTKEIRPGAITIDRAVNPTGTIANETNGRRYKTSYTYDGMNHLRTITPPLGTATTITWTGTGRTVARGTYSQVTTFDGFGRPGLINTGGIIQNINYNALGYKSFVSYPATPVSTSGDTFTTDVLGRVTAVVHGGDNTSRGFQFLLNNQVRITNERNYPTTLAYRSFGDPDNTQDKVLMAVSAPEGITTSFVRNILGQPTSITQGSVTRTYGYNSTNNFLTSVTQPEIGTTTFGRDALGNMQSRSVGSSGTTNYTYDGQNRLTHIDYPGTTPDVSQDYDANDNLAYTDNGNTRMDYTYDANDNLKTETLATGGRVFPFVYTYNTLDYLSYVTYPSFRQVGYAPDALGRPTNVTPYVNVVTHWPNGVPKQLKYANGQVTDSTLNPRQWVSRISTQKTGVGYAMDLSYFYDGLANVSDITNTLDITDSKHMTYDSVDRLTTAGAASIGYNTDDNITSMTTGAGSLTYSYTSNRLSSVSGWKSTTYNYDNYGNVIRNGPNTFVYDDASNLRSVTGTATATYDYDGKNMRVHAVKNGLESYYLYAGNGNLLGEYDANGTWVKEYAYLGDKLVAKVTNVPTVYVPPSSPSSIAVPATNSTGNYSVSWGAATGTVTRYELYEAVASKGAGSTFADALLVYSGLKLSTALINKASRTYYYQVRACNGTACSDYQVGTNGVVVNAPPPPLPGAPGGITFPTTAILGVPYTISWGAASGTVANYVLYESDDPTFSTIGLCTANIPPTCYGTLLTYSGRGLSTIGPNSTRSRSPATYYYRVRACNESGCGPYATGNNGVVVQ